MFYRIIHKRRMRQVHTGNRIRKEEWNDEAGRVDVSGADPRAVYLNAVQSSLREGKSRFSLIISSLEKAGCEYTVDDIVARYNAPDTVVGFLSFARRHILGLRQTGRCRASDHYTTTMNSFIRFHGDSEIPFANFNSPLILRYESYLRDRELIPNSTSYYMRNLRAIYNQAVEQGLTEQCNPFRHVYTGVAKTVKRAVTIDTIRALKGMGIGHDPLDVLARDLFLFSFYTRGMAIIDVANLRKGNLRDGALTYRRRKTGQLLSIKWEPQMQEIVDRHHDSDSDFLFPMIDSRKPDFRRQYLNAYNRLSRRLKDIGRQLGLAEPLTFHRARHTWASIARENNVPLSVICEGMGHDSERTTRIYLASLDTSVVDKANRDIINLLDI